MSRSTPEWIGRTDDETVPPRVRLRIFERHHGICHIAKRKIRPGEPWQLDHIKALCNGGEHRESNLAPALVDKHKDKTKDDVAEKSEAYESRLRHAGIKTRSRPLPGSKASGWKQTFYNGWIRR